MRQTKFLGLVTALPEKRSGELILKWCKISPDKVFNLADEHKVISEEK
jgi:hypothetical protein